MLCGRGWSLGTIGFVLTYEVVLIVISLYATGARKR